MEFSFISNKPWVDETIKLRRALFFTTLFMVILGVILAIIGIVLLAYQEFVVGVIAIIFGIALPLLYVGANVLLFAKRRKDYDKSMIIEYKFTEDALEIIRLSDKFKSKDVVDYSNLKVNKVYNKSRFIVIKTKSCFADYIVLRKSDIKIEDGMNNGQAIVSFVSFLMAKVAEAARVSEITCSENAQDNDDVIKDENDSKCEINGLNEENTTSDDMKNIDDGSNAQDENEVVTNECDDTVAEDSEKTDEDDADVEYDKKTDEGDTVIEDGEKADEVVFDDLIKKDENVDIDDEKEDIEVTPTHSVSDVKVKGADDEEYKALFDYSEKMNVDDEPKSEPKTSYFQDYGSDEGGKN